MQKHDWFMAELYYITSLSRTLRTWEKAAVSRLAGDAAESLGLDREAYQNEVAREFNVSCTVTLKIISEMFNIPYQSVRRYAAQHEWRKKRVQFRYNVYKRLQEKTIHLLFG